MKKAGKSLMRKSLARAAAKGSGKWMGQDVRKPFKVFTIGGDR